MCHPPLVSNHVPRVGHLQLTLQSAHLQDGVIWPALVVIVAREEVTTLVVLCSCILSKVEVHIAQLVEERGAKGRGEEGRGGQVRVEESLKLSFLF